MAEPAELKLPFGNGDIWLRAIEPSDAMAMLPYFSNPDVCRYIPWEPRDLAGVSKFISERALAQVPVSDGEHFILGIETQMHGLVGQLNFTLKSAKDSSGEFGYVINPAFGGEGIATLAVEIFLQLLFVELGFRRVTAWIDSRNQRSIALANRIGMRLEATEVEVELFKGELVTMHSYALLSREWPSKTTL